MPSRVRVVFVDDTFTFGGAITSLGHLVNGLRAYDVDVTVVSGQDGEALRQLFPGSRTYSIPLKLPWVHADPFETVERLGPAARLARSLYWFTTGDLLTAMRIARIAYRHRADIIHLNNGWQLDGALAAYVLRVVCVSHLRGFWNPPSNPETPPRLVGLARQAMRFLRHGIAPPRVTLPVSHAVGRDLEKVGIAREAITVVHDAIDLDTFHPGPPPEGLSESLSIPDGATVVGHFGRVIWWKGTLEFVTGFARVAADVPELHALIVGDASDGAEEYERAVHRAVEEYGLSERVTFTGFRSDVADLMRLCDILVHSSVAPEPFGMVIVEGMATGNAVIAADAGGPLEIIEDGVNGCLVDPEDPDAMAEKIRALAIDPVYRKAIADAGMARTASYFSKERYASDVVAVYRRLLGIEIAGVVDSGAGVRQ